jgi:hypothetical protein
LLNKGYESSRKMNSKLPSKSLRKNVDFSPKKKTLNSDLSKGYLNKTRNKLDN